MNPFENEHGARAGFNAGLVDLICTLFEMQAVLCRTEPGVFASFLDDKIEVVTKGADAPMVKAARILPLQAVSERLSTKTLSELRSSYGVRSE
jgi:hypothetical protein